MKKYSAAYRCLDTAERKTVLYDTIRQGIEGGGEPLASVLFLFLAIEIFALPSEQKALLVASRAIGFCLAPFLPMLFARSRWRRSSLAASCNILSGTCLVLAGNTGDGWAYTIFCSLFIFFLCVKVPLFTYIYRENYQGSRRGKLFALGSTLRNVCNLLLNILTALLIRENLEMYRWVFMGYGLLIIGSGLISYLIPSQRFCAVEVQETLEGQNHSANHFWHRARASLALLLRDRLFLYICFAWYLLGFGNLALAPMRVEFLLGKEQGSFVLGSLEPLQLVFVLQILPGLIRSVGTIFGGRLFDYIPPLQFRILTNLLFIVATVLFFQAGSYVMLLAGMVIFGLAESGAQFIWNLWMTHLAPQKKDVELYMGAHVFLNGTRGLLAPFVSYALLEGSLTQSLSQHGLHGISGLSWLTAGLMALSTLLFISMLRSPRINLRS